MGLHFLSFLGLSALLLAAPGVADAQYFLKYDVPPPATATRNADSADVGDGTFSWNLPPPPNNLVILGVVNGAPQPGSPDIQNQDPPAGTDTGPFHISPLGSPGTPYTVNVQLFPATNGIPIGTGIEIGVQCNTLGAGQGTATFSPVAAPPQPAGPFAYIANNIGNTVSVIDTATNAVVGLPIAMGGNPRAVAVNPAGSRVYVANSTGNTVSVIDTGTSAVAGAPIAVGTNPQGVAVNPAGTRVYVANFGSNNVSVIDTATHTVVGTPIAAGTGPRGIAVNPAGTRVYVGNTGSGNVSVIDATTNTVVGAPIAVGTNPQGIAVNPAGTRVYVANFASDNVSVIDTATNTVVGTPIAVGDGPRGVAINPAGNRVYVANNFGDSVSVIATATHAVIGMPITVGDGPHGIAINPAGTRVYVANSGSDNVSVIDTANNTVVGAPIAVGDAPLSLGQFIGTLHTFDYDPVVMPQARTLFLYTPSVGPGGAVEINGVDTALLSAPFSWDWGDGSSVPGYFPKQHTYADTTRNYVVRVTSFHADATTQQAAVVVFFVPASVDPVPLPPGVSVQIPSQPVTLQSHYTYPPPTDLSPLADSSFTTYSRSSMAHVLGALATIQKDFANDDVFLASGDFIQVILQNASFGGGITYWYTTPMAAGFGPSVVASPTLWWLLFNEMGKNTTLNTPLALPYGGNTDGHASEIYSETMGNVFSYAAGYELVNNAAAYGLGNDVAADVGNSLLDGAANLRQQYEAYVAAGAPFSSWNPYDGSPDPTLGTVATLAYKFIEHAHARGNGYRLPAKRFMRCLQTFDASMLASYDPQHNTQAGATYRSTLLVKALSYAFAADLRSEFRTLNFPIDDAAYAAICADLPPAGTLDVDASNAATKYDALTDGLLILRYLFGLRGNSLIAGAIGPLATRTTAPAIEVRIETLMP